MMWLGAWSVLVPMSAWMVLMSDFFWFVIWSTIDSIVLFSCSLLTALGDDAHTPSLALSPAGECL